MKQFYVQTKCPFAYVLICVILRIQRCYWSKTFLPLQSDFETRNILKINRCHKIFYKTYRIKSMTFVGVSIQRVKSMFCPKAVDESITLTEIRNPNVYSQDEVAVSHVLGLKSVKDMDTALLDICEYRYQQRKRTKNSSNNSKEVRIAGVLSLSVLARASKCTSQI